MAELSLPFIPCNKCSHHKHSPGNCDNCNCGENDVVRPPRYGMDLDARVHSGMRGELFSGVGYWTPPVLYDDNY